MHTRTPPEDERDPPFLVTPGATHGQQGGAHSRSQRELDGSGSVAAVGAAAGLGDGVPSSQEGPRLGFVAGGGVQAASSLQAQQTADVES